MMKYIAMSDILLKRYIKVRVLIDRRIITTFSALKACLFYSLELSVM